MLACYYCNSALQVGCLAEIGNRQLVDVAVYMQSACLCSRQLNHLRATAHLSTLPCERLTNLQFTV